MPFDLDSLSVTGTPVPVWGGHRLVAPRLRRYDRELSESELRKFLRRPFVVGVSRPTFGYAAKTTAQESVDRHACGQFLGSGKRFEYESITSASSVATLVWSSSKDILTTWQKSGYERCSSPKNRGPKSLNQHSTAIGAMFDEVFTGQRTVRVDRIDGEWAVHISPAKD